MSRSQFGLGYHKGKIDEQDYQQQWSYDCTIGEIDYLLDKLSAMLQQKIQSIRIDETGDDVDINVLAKVITMLNSNKMLLKVNQKERVE